MNNEVTIDNFDQDKDADFTNIKIRNKHFVIKAPKKETDSGIVLTDEARRQVQSVQEMPTFQENITVIEKAQDCTQVEKGDMIILSPHVQALEMVIENVLYLMVHEDYVLATKSAE